MNIETVEELCEHLADRVGVYGIDRTNFVSEIEERIRLAIKNEGVISNLNHANTEKRFCNCRFGLKKKGFDKCQMCGGKWKGRTKIKTP